MSRTFFALLAVASLCGCSRKPELHVYNWCDYISPEYIAGFEERHGCRVVVDSFDSNEAMYAKLKAGATGYDVIVPSSYFVGLMADEGIIERLDHSKLPNVFKNFDHRYDRQLDDAGCEYCIPYIVTYTGLLYDKEKTGCELDSWSCLGDAKYAGQMSMLDDFRETIGAGLMYNGFSINSTSEREIAAAVDTVRGWKRNVRKFDCESYKTEVANGFTIIGHGYSSDSVQLIMNSAGGALAFALPKEGFCIAWDTFVITKRSENKDLAYAFIDELYGTDAATENMNYVCGIMPQREAIDMLGADMKAALIPDAGVLSYGQVLKNFPAGSPAHALYDKAWNDIKRAD